MEANAYVHLSLFRIWNKWSNKTINISQNINNKLINIIPKIMNIETRYRKSVKIISKLKVFKLLKNGAELWYLDRSIKKNYYLKRTNAKILLNGKLIN